MAQKVQFLLVISAALLAGTVGVAAGLYVPPAAGATGPLLVVVAPWSGTPEDIVTRAGGTVIGPDRAPMSVLAQGATPDALEQAGAFWVLDPSALSLFCSDGIDG